MIKKDYIIVGQGISGTLLSYQLIKMKKEIIIINQTVPSSSSMVAAGIFNPVTGKRMVKTWNAEKLFSYLEPFYQQMENDLQASFFFPKEIYRPFFSIEEQNEVMGKSASGELQEFINYTSTNSRFGNIIKDELGGISFKKTGFIDLLKMIDSFKQQMVFKQSYLEEKFNENELIVFDNYVKYKNIIADKVVFCDGMESRNGIYFNWLPFNLVKGELLIIKTTINFNIIFTRGIFILPIGGGFYKVGATYNWSDLTIEPTISARKELVEKLKNLLKIPFEIVDQIAGIRPATKDRRPFIGIHPRYKTLAIFNGLGTKGVSIAPYYSGQFADCLISQKELDQDVNINRYISLYNN